MKRVLFFASILFLAFGCNKFESVEHPQENLEGEAVCDSPVLFGLTEEGSETKSGLSVDVYEDSLFCVTREALEPIFIKSESETKVSITTQSNLTSFYLNTTKGSSETVVSTNTVFTGTSGNNYTASDGMYWPATDPSYHFYASNKQLQITSTTYYLLTCAADQDIVYAYNASPTHKQVNNLAFNHVYGRIGTVSISAPTGFTGTLTSATITASKSGTFNVKNGSWSSKASNQNISLDSSNDVWVVPGSYTMSVTFNLSDGSTTQNSITRSGTVTIVANKINNIAVKVNDKYEYELEVTPSSANINIGGSQAYTATYKTKYNSSVIASSNVTSSASWSSNNTAVATVNSGTATGVGSGTATLTASYLSKSAIATINVSDYITGIEYRNVSVSISANPTSLAATAGSSTLSYSASYEYRNVYASGTYGNWTPASGTPTISGSAPGFTRNGTSVSVTANTSSSSRSVTYYANFSIDGHSASQKSVTITQAGDVSTTEYRNASVSISANPTTFTAAGGTSTLSYSASYEWRTVHSCGTGTTNWAPASGTPTITGSATGFSRNGTTVTVAVNNNNTTRTVTYYANFSIGNSTATEQSVTITQTGAIIIDFDD